MLEITIPKQHYEFFDDAKNEFGEVNVKETKLQLEHSLISLKKWEQRWHKPFLGSSEKTYEELSDYVRCMTLTHGVDQEVYHWIPKDVLEKIVEYIKDPMTATWFNENKLIGAQKVVKGQKEIVTSEIIYYWMITLNIPVEFQKWHLNQLLTLIKVVNIKNGKPEKKDPKEAARERAALNAKRRAELNSKG